MSKRKHLMNGVMKWTKWQGKAPVYARECLRLEAIILPYRYQTNNCLSNLKY
jgi:hypothetical protein